MLVKYRVLLNLEERRFKNSVIKVSDTDFITSDNEILNECETFYHNVNIYRSKTNSHVFNSWTLDVLTRTECLQALKGMNWEERPGSDGLPADLYNVFGTI